MRSMTSIILKITLKPIIIIPALLILIYSSYSSTITYLKFKILDKGELNWGGFYIKMEDGWFPYDYNNGLAHPHITFLKINPWIPNGTLLSKLDLICHQEPAHAISSNFLSEKHHWGEIKFYKDKNVAFAFNGKLRIFFYHKTDLNEVINIQYSNNLDTSYCEQ